MGNDATDTIYRLVLVGRGFARRHSRFVNMIRGSFKLQARCRLKRSRSCCRLRTDLSGVTDRHVVVGPTVYLKEGTVAVKMLIFLFASKLRAIEWGAGVSLAEMVGM